MRVRRALALVAVFAVCGAPSFAASTPPEHPWCGTHPGRLAASLALHRQQLRHQARHPQAKAEAEGMTSADRVGDVAIVSSPTIVLDPRPLDVEQVGIRFAPQKKGTYRVSLVGVAFRDDIGDRVALTDDGSVAFKLPKGFRFPFFKKRYTGFFLQSDGNVTFGAGDGVSVARSVTNFAGLPRIAALYGDLNPEDARDGGGIYVNLTKTEVVITWLEVPAFDDPEAPGTPGPNTFQMTLAKNGTVTFVYGDIDTTEAVIGLAPGIGNALTLLDYTSEAPTGALGGAIAERFSLERDLDDLAIAKTFYTQFADVYDHLVVFLDFNFSLGGAFAYEFTVKNEVQGIGEPVFDATAASGSKGRLRAFAQMGWVARYQPDPDSPTLGAESGIDVVAHENGHRWLSFVAVPGEGGGVSDALLGRQRAHWSAFFNSEASQLEGSRLRDRGNGSFESIAFSEHYSDLDRYLMGLIPPGQVPGSTYFYVADARGGGREEKPPVGRVITGRRVDVDIEDIIAANGPRVPASAAAQKAFRMAFVLVTLPGQGPTPEGLAKVEAYRTRWETYFTEATAGLGSADTTLQNRGRGGRGGGSR
jgi:hypothetical protein